DHEERPREFHYVDLVAGNNEYNQLKKKERKNLADSVFAIIENIDPTLFAVIVKKLEHHKKYREQGKKPILAPFIGPVWLINRFDKYLARTDELGCIIIDNEHRARDELKQLWMYQAMEDGGIVGPRTRNDLDELYYDSTYYPQIIETCFFTPSHLSPGVQLADACCYAISHHFRYGREGERFRQIEPYFDSTPDGKQYGIMFWPSED
ncbi:MAG: DUF3800 domain-containing protein, partial [Candidatus Thorarchaeota archaeon]